MVNKLNVKLRSLQSEDANDLASAINNKKVQDNLRDGIPFPYSQNDAADYINATVNAEKGSQYAFAIVYDDKVIGNIAVFRKDNIHHRTGELGYYIAEAYWGKGIMTQAVRQICDYVFKNTDIIRIFAEPFAYNTASCRVLTKAGFEYEGALHQNAVKNGKVIDMNMYALIKPQDTLEVKTHE